MKNLVFLIPLLALISSCCGKNSSTCQSNCCTSDSIKITKNLGDTASFCGIAIDGAMNSILICTADGDTLSFGYPEINPSSKDSWMIGDTMIVRTVKINGIDSVITLRQKK
ncbi:MAG: hypothetical protein PHR45_05455 [Muribaculaceae bacterium]|nr:hypothetical protein [Muribaculaceae bacterium]